MTLTEILEQQRHWRRNIISDITSDWVTDDDAAAFSFQLTMLNQSISAIETILDTAPEQLFNSSISK